MWGILVIEQTYKDDSDAVTLKDSVFDSRAIGAKYYESTSTTRRVDADGKWSRRTQVYLIKPQKPNDRLQLEANDFKNLKGGLRGELVMTIEDRK